MKDIKVLGPGCKRCVETADMVQAQADKLGVPVTIEKVTDYAEIAGYGIAATPGIVIDGKVVHAGGLPKAGRSCALAGHLKPSAKRAQGLLFALRPDHRPAEADGGQETLHRPLERLRHVRHQRRKLPLQARRRRRARGACRPDQHAARLAHVGGARPWAPFRRPVEIDVRAARRGERDERRQAPVAGDVLQRLAGAALIRLGEEAAFGVGRLRHARIDRGDPRHHRDAGDGDQRRRHQDAEPGRGDQPLAVEQYAVAGHGDDRQPRQHEEWRGCVERSEPLARRRDGDRDQRRASAKT